MERIRKAVLITWFCLCLLPADILAAEMTSKVRGDANSDGAVDLADAVLINQFLTGAPVNINSGADVNRDGKIGLEEFIYVLQIIAELRYDLKAVYEKYFLDHPKIASASINILDEETVSYFWFNLEELVNTGKITVAKPAQLGNWPAGAWNGMVVLTELEVKKIWAAKTAHAIWLDKTKKVPWRLNDYTVEELKGLFDKTWLFDRRMPNSETILFDVMSSVVDYSPSDVYGYMKSNGLIKTDQLNSLYAVADDLRTTDTKISFVHWSLSYGDIGNVAYSLYEALTTWHDRGYAKVRVSRQGGGTMAHIMIGMLRSINIPGTIWHTLYGIPGLAGGDWPSLKVVMIYGDDLYNSMFGATPTAEIFPSYAYYEDPANTAVCGNDRTCLSHRFYYLRFIAHHGNALYYMYCRPKIFSFNSCEDFMKIGDGINGINNGFEGRLTPAELKTALDLCQLCPQ